jgi:hypothetical protein
MRYVSRTLTSLPEWGTGKLFLFLRCVDYRLLLCFCVGFALALFGIGLTQSPQSPFLELVRG